MDVRADDTRLGSDPPARSTPRPADAAGPIVYTHGSPAHADTAETPIVGYEVARPSRSSRVLKVAVIVVAVAVVGAGVALALVEAGVIDKTTGPSSATPPVTHTTSVSRAPLVTQTSAGPGTANYQVAVHAFEVTVATGSHRSWVSIGVVGQKPIYEGIMQAGMQQHEVLLGAAQVDVGAGGTTVTVSSNKRTTTLTPPSAPFTYNFTPG